jgi:hypothetical protein
VADIPFVYPSDDEEDIARNAEREEKDYLSRGFSATDAWELVRS